MFDYSFFDKIYDRTNTSAIKYTDLPKSEKGTVIPMWIADMDFLSAPAITEALKRTADHGIYGYGEIDEEYKNLVTNWYNRRMGWKIEKDELLTMPGVMFGVTMAIRALTKENDAVLICQPVYYPFKNVVLNNNRKLVVNELVLNNGRYEIDFKDFEEKTKDIAQKLFGNSEESLPDDICHFLLNSCTFGNSEVVFVSDTIRNRKGKNSVSNGISRIIRKIFPKVSWMRLRFSTVDKMPFLYPFFLPAHWIDRVFVKRNVKTANISSYFASDSSENAKNLRSLYLSLGLEKRI